jgi:putative two-component system response regulator
MPSQIFKGTAFMSKSNAPSVLGRPGRATAISGYLDSASADDDSHLRQMSAYVVDLRMALKERDAALAQAQRAENARVNFVQQLAQQLRLPVTALRATAQALQGQPKPAPAGTVATICGLADHLLSQLEAMVSSATPVAEGVDDNLPTIGSEDLLRLTERLVADHHAQASDRGLRLQTLSRGEPGVQRWPVDGARLHQLADELVDNAVRHSGKGEVTLVADFSPRRDTIARLHVIDDGCGAPISDFAPLTESSMRDGDLPTPRGVGLFKARALADQLGCKLHVRSTTHLGTRITIDMPQPVQKGRKKVVTAAGAMDSGEQLVRLQKDLFSLTRAQAQSDNKLQLARLDGLMRLVAAAELKDDDTGAHIVRMGFFSAYIARSLGQNSRYCEMMLHASRMHDVGKIGVPDSVLKKPGALTPQEWEVMRRHPEIGAELLRGANDPMYDMAAEIALAHHEKWDGSGYPNRLANVDIPLSARIVSLADYFDAVTMDRCYRPAMTDEQACKLIREGSGKHFDPQVVAAFFRALPHLQMVRERINRGEVVEL